MTTRRTLLHLSHYALLTLASASGRTIETLVQTEDGKAVPEALVSLHRMNGVSAVPIQAKSGGDGKVQQVVPDEGDWKICASAVSKNFLDSCMWENEFPQELKVAPGAGRATPAVTLRKGVVLRFQINDPESLLKDGEREVAMGVITDGGRAYSAHAMESNGKVRTFEILIPEGIKLVVYATPVGVSIQDDDKSLPSLDSPSYIVAGEREASRVRRFTVRRIVN